MTQPLVTKIGNIKPAFRTAVVQKAASLKEAWQKGGHYSQTDARAYEADEIDTGFQWFAWLCLA